MRGIFNRIGKILGFVSPKAETPAPISDITIENYERDRRAEYERYFNITL